MAINFKLERVMEEKDITIHELSLQTGIAVFNLTDLQNGRVNALRLATLELLCEKLNCQPGDILEYVKKS